MFMSGALGGGETRSLQAPAHLYLHLLHTTHPSNYQAPVNSCGLQITWP